MMQDQIIINKLQNDLIIKNNRIKKLEAELVEAILALKDVVRNETGREIPSEILAILPLANEL